MSKIAMKLRQGKPTEIKVHGIPGQQCHQISAPFETIAGSQILSSTPTAEATQPAVISQSVEQNIGG